MIGVVLRVAGLTAIYLLVLTSLDPGDVVIGAALALVLVIAARPSDAHRAAAGWDRWFAALGRMIVVTAREIGLGTVRVVRFCLRGTGSPGFVEIPRDDRSRRGIALWGILTGEAPDEYPVAVDDVRHVLVVHTIDARDPEAIVARHAAARETFQRDVVP
jgi:multisubunit Na+/H+ antiporter MnhE subunit